MIACLTLFSRRQAAWALMKCHAFHATTSRRKDLVSTSLDSSTGIATITMQNPPVNSLSVEMIQSLSRAIQTASQDTSIQSLILASANPKIFSAGLDLTVLHQPDPDRLQALWSAFQQLYLDLYGSRLACIAAIQGHAPAAGCMLALSCDYRIMGTTKQAAATIGLNESQLGIVAPPWLAQQMMDTIGRRRAELALSLGLLYTAEEALEIGLIDELVPMDEVQERAYQAAVQWGKIPPNGRMAIKMQVRRERLNQLEATRQEDLDNFCRVVTSDKVQRDLTSYLEVLAQRSAKK